MPSKSHRAASRQAKLRQKRRRVKAADQVFEAGPERSTAMVEATATDDQVGPDPRPAAVAPDPSPLQPVRRARQSQSGTAASRYAHLGAEIRRIGIISILIFAILAAVSFVLGG
jgi:hypothetical protein